MTAPLFRPSLVSMATSMEIAFNHSFCVRSFLWGSQGGASLLEASPDSMDCWDQYAKLGPFFTSSFDCNFPAKNNQPFIVYMKSTLVLVRKGLFFPVYPRRKVMRSKVLQVLRTRGSIKVQQNNLYFISMNSSDNLKKSLKNLNIFHHKSNCNYSKMQSDQSMILE